AAQKGPLSFPLPARPGRFRAPGAGFRADWGDGTSVSCPPPPGCSSLLWKPNPDLPLTLPGRDLCALILGQGGAAGAVARAPPPAPGGLRSETGTLPAGEASVSWVSPRDEGPSGTVGFFVRVDGRDVPRYLVPLSSTAGDRVTMHLRDLGLAPGAEVALAVRA